VPSTTWTERGRRAARLALLSVALVHTARAQDPPDIARSIDDLREAGRPWHAAELADGRGASDTEPRMVMAEAAGAFAAHQYERARALLSGRSWLDADEGAGRAVLGEAEAALGLWDAAVSDLEAARRAARPPVAWLLAVRVGAAFEALGARDSAARAYAAARGLTGIGDWLRVREARVTGDTTRAFALLAGLKAAAARAVPVARAEALLAAGDTALAIPAFAAAGRPLDVGELALATGDSTVAREAIYGIMAHAPESDPADVAAGWALARLPPRTAAERVALARALKGHGAPSDGLREVERAVLGGDSSGATRELLGDLCVATGRARAGIRAYAAAAADSTVAPAALYARARALLRLRDPAATAELAAFASRYPADTAAPAALFLVGETAVEQGDWTAARRSFGDLVTRYPTDLRASRARFRLAAEAVRRGRPDSAVALYEQEVAAPGPQRQAARYWLGRLAVGRGDSVAARDLWSALARDDSLGYYGLRARSAAGLPALHVTPGSLTPPAGANSGLATLDTLALAGLDSEAALEVETLVSDPPADADALLVWSTGLAARGWGPAAVRLAWLAAQRAPGDPRVLGAIFPWPNRTALEAEAREFGLDPLLLAALVRQESVFNPEARSTAGARGLAQLLPSTAAATARALDIPFEPAWITVPDLNLHLGAAHLASLLRRFGGRVDAAVAAYDAGAPPVERWLARPDAQDPDHFIELIPYEETRGYTRAVLRNWTIYRALYAATTD